MKTYPGYDVVSTVMNGNRCTVTVKAKTKCGPTIEAKSTVTVSNTAPEETLKRLIAETRKIAVRNLGYEYQVVINNCTKHSKH